MIVFLSENEIFFQLNILINFAVWRNIHVLLYFISFRGNRGSDHMLVQGRIQGEGARTRRAPLKLGKIWFFSVKSWFFTRNTATIFAPPSARRIFFKCAPLTWNPGSAPEYYRRINIHFKGTGIFDLKRTQIYTHTFAWSEVIDNIEFWSCFFSSPGHRPCHELLSWVSVRRPSVRPLAFHI